MFKGRVQLDKFQFLNNPLNQLLSSSFCDFLSLSLRIWIFWWMDSLWLERFIQHMPSKSSQCTLGLVALFCRWLCLMILTFARGSFSAWDVALVCLLSQHLKFFSIFKAFAAVTPMVNIEAAIPFPLPQKLILSLQSDSNWWTNLLCLIFWSWIMVILGASTVSLPKLHGVLAEELIEVFYLLKHNHNLSPRWLIENVLKFENLWNKDAVFGKE